eukprot:9489302-Pyramimonas_sp.AAC.1
MSWLSSMKTAVVLTSGHPCAPQEVLSVTSVTLSPYSGVAVVLASHLLVFCKSPSRNSASLA